MTNTIKLHDGRGGFRVSGDTCVCVRIPEPCSIILFIPQYCESVILNHCSAYHRYELAGRGLHNNQAPAGESMCL